MSIFASEMKNNMLTSKEVKSITGNSEGCNTDFKLCVPSIKTY
jgi:hypothetical protein